MDFEDVLLSALRDELEDTLTKALNQANTEAADVRRKDMILDAFSRSIQMQRLYFVVRSAIMSAISALFFFIVVWYLGTVNVVQAVFLGLFLFIFSLFFSRLFDKQIIMVSRWIISYMERHRRVRMVVLSKL
ncbi:MAG: hypothetical protein QXU99_06705 [Candidatus Bathyarchaeia archaeon]